ncbi:MAG: DUF4924 family protein [Rikenellaceae bacterium]
MLTAQSKRKENIAEYILYLWQLEDLLRALKFSPKDIFAHLIEPFEGLDQMQQQDILIWYMDIINLLREEGKEQNGHLDHTMHLIDDMNNLHLQLLKFPIGADYRAVYSNVEAEIPGMKERLGRKDMSDVELFMKALYAVVLLRIKNKGNDNDPYINDVMTLISPVVAALADMYRKVETGEVDLYKGMD